MIDEEIGLIPINSNTTNPKELFDVANVEVRSELTAEQVMIVTRMKFLSETLKSKYKIIIVDDFIEYFLKLQISKDRNSRKEFVNAYQSKNDEKVGGLMDRLSFNVNK